MAGATRAGLARRLRRRPDALYPLRFLAAGYAEILARLGDPRTVPVPGRRPLFTGLVPTLEAIHRLQHKTGNPVRLILVPDGQK
jgi:hypothetical protein